MTDRATAGDAARPAAGFRTSGEMADLAKTCRIFDPASTLVSRSVVIAPGNVIYPGVVIEAGAGAVVVVGEGNLFWPGTTIVARSGRIAIGARNEFGPGGATLLLDAGEISVGDDGRYREGAVIHAGCRLGSGSQVLGPIQVQDCVLDAGGSHCDAAVDLRGAVLKGAGRARGLHVGRGRVILGEGRFDAEDVKAQSFFHPPA
jgi:NDP-sugar pyrophosphorylase family protein